MRRYGTALQKVQVSYDTTGHDGLLTIRVPYTMEHYAPSISVTQGIRPSRSSVSVSLTAFWRTSVTRYTIARRPSLAKLPLQLRHL